MTTRQYAACRRMDRGHWTRPACVRYSLASPHESDLNLPPHWKSGPSSFCLDTPNWTHS
jgi:hypothetical protein